MRRSIYVLAALLVATPAIAGEFYNKDKGDQRRGEATEDMALVYVFRPAIAGAAIRTWAFADDQFLGVSKAKAYFFAHVPPGKHVFWAKAENTSGVEVEVEAGKTYYFKKSMRPGIGKARVKMVQIEEAEAEGLFGKCDFVEATEEGKQRGAEIAANRQDRAVTSAEKKKAKGG